MWTASLIMNLFLLIIDFSRNTLSFKTVLELYLFTILGLDKLVLKSHLLNREHRWGANLGGHERCRRRISDRALILPLNSLLDGLLTISILGPNIDLFHAKSNLLPSNGLGVLRVSFPHFAEQNQHFSEVRKVFDATHVFFDMDIAVLGRFKSWIRGNMELGILTRRSGWSPWWSFWNILGLLRFWDGPKKVWHNGVIHDWFRLEQAISV